MIGMIVLSVPTFWAFERFGYKKAVGFGSLLMGVAALFRGVLGDNYTALLVTTILFSVAQPFILNSVGLVAGKWFPAKERATANGIGLLASYVGMIVGLVLTPILFEGGSSIKEILLIYGIFALVVGVLFVILTREKPPTPPCADEDSERVGFKDGIKSIFKKPAFLFLLIGFFFIFGVFNTFFTLIEPILKNFSSGGVDETQIGIIGMAILVVGILGSVIIPIFSDKSKGQRRKPFIVVATLGGTVGIAMFMAMHDFNGMLIAGVVYGLCAVGIAPVVMAFAAESSYPVSEGTSEGLLMFSGNVAGVIFIGLASLFGGNYYSIMILLTIFMVVSLVAFFLAKEKKSTPTL
jgi:MFS family permease